MANDSAYEKYWAASRYYLTLTESAEGRQKQAYLRKAALARKIANAKLRGGNGVYLDFYADRFNVTLNTIKRDIWKINSKANEPDLVARVRALLPS